MTDRDEMIMNPARWRNRRMTKIMLPQKVGDLAIKSQWREYSHMESILEYLNDISWRGTLAWITLGLLCVGATYAVPWLFTSIARWFR